MCGHSPSPAVGSSIVSTRALRLRNLRRVLAVGARLCIGHRGSPVVAEIDDAAGEKPERQVADDEQDETGIQKLRTRWTYFRLIGRTEVHHRHDTEVKVGAD